jgi:predicted DNA-binding transcriptional regulator AlpA
MNNDHNPNHKMSHRVLPPKEAAFMLGVSKTTLWAMASEDSGFPPRIQMTERRCGWRYKDLVEYIDSKAVNGVSH